MNSLILPLVCYFLLVLGIAVWGSRQSKTSSDAKSFMEEYFIGGRSMGGLVLAMSIITAYTSASSFIGGPGIAYNTGLSWILLSMIQVPTAFLTLGVLGKRFAIISRRTNAVTITDFLRARYGSDTVVILSSAALLVFFMASMLAQFIGGARLFESITGYSYETGLIIFGITVILYTTIGGFRAVVLTDLIQGFMMLVASSAVLLAVTKAGGGVANIIQTLYKTDPSLLTPYGAGNAIPLPFMLSFWVLVGFGILGLPQTTQKCLGFKDSKSLHNAMIIGTLAIGFPMLAMHLAGVMGRAVMPGIKICDLVISTLTIKLMPPFWAGIFIAGPLAAIMSTIDSMLIMCSAAVVKDLYFHYAAKTDGSCVTPAKLKKMSFTVTAVTGLIVFISAMRPPALLVWINLFAFGGLEAVFFCPILFGLYWRKANAAGAVCSMLAGCAAFFFFTITKVSVCGTTAIVPSLSVSVIAFVLGSLFAKAEDETLLKNFDF